MSKTTKLVTATELKAAPQPAKTATYTVISHGFIIDEVTRELNNAGFEVVHEEYRANNNLEVARGSYIIKRAEDPSFSMSFNWVNSYDKSTKFQCSVGGYVWENNSYVIEKEDNTFIRKHTGSADELVKQTIADKIANAEKYYQSVLNTKKLMETRTVSRGEVAKILGDLYFNFDMISIEQLSGIKKEYMKPSYVYSTYSDSLWTIYCHILTIIKSSHPKAWLMQQGFIHNYLKLNYLTLTNPVITSVPKAFMDALAKAPEVEVHPGQIDLLDAIAEAEEEVVTQPDNEDDVTEVKLPEEPVYDEDDITEEPSSAIEDNFTEEEIAEVEEAKALNVEWTTDNKITDIKVLSFLQKEVNDIFGYSLGIDVYQNGDSYSIMTSDGQEVTVPISYVNNSIS